MSRWYLCNSGNCKATLGCVVDLEAEMKHIGLITAV